MLLGYGRVTCLCCTACDVYNIVLYRERAAFRSFAARMTYIFFTSTFMYRFSCVLVFIKNVAALDKCPQCPPLNAGLPLCVPEPVYKQPRDEGDVDGLRSR